MSNYDKKPFPWRCSNCGEKSIREATVEYTMQMHHDGCAYTVKIDRLKTPKCVNCGRIKLDVEALDVLTDTFIRQLNLLTPDQIRAHRVQANMTQQKLAAALGVSEATVACWENGGQIQSRSLDHLLRLFFGLTQVREILTTQQIGTLASTLASQ